MQLPFENKNSYGFMSQDPNNQFVKDYMSAPIEVDPGAAQRTDLAEQSAQHRWGGGFAAGLPEAYRLRNQGAESQQIRAQGARDQQNANYAQSMAEVARKERLLPQLVQTGGNTSGYNSQQQQPGGFWNSLIQGASNVGSAFLMRP